ncbi:MAG: hypothetical protein WBE98_06370, partial [Gammaproteobacteria bacterium]
MARRRDLTVFSLSFLDAITCGFGAIILFDMVIVANIDLRHDLIVEEAAGEVDRLELRVLAGRKNLVQAREELASKLEERTVLDGLKRRLASEVEQTQEDFLRMTEES